jgi:hypothetical protein
VNDRQQYDLGELIMKSLDGAASESDFEKLRQFLADNPEAMDYYLEYVGLYAYLQSPGNVSFPKPEDIHDFQVWQSLAEYENAAPGIKIIPPPKAKVLVEKVRLQKMNRKISKGSLATLFAAAAAIVIIFVFARFVPPKTGVEVATLTDSIKAKWADAVTPMDKGVRLATGSTGYLLREGIAQIEFDNQAKVTIESPAEFEIVTGDQVKLNYGRLYATVPQSAIGFAVQTLSARIIDLGTEFGIDASTGGDTSLHVIKGKITLIAGKKSSKVSMEVGAGYAKKISGATHQVSDIPCQKELFVRMIDSKEKLVWKGQNQLSLADIVGGGNGLGTGQLYTGINPVTGQKTSPYFDNRKTTNEYRSVASNPFIDGVFVPNGRTEQIISSMDHVFQECPITTGDMWTDIIRMPISSGKEWKPEGISNSRGRLVQGANLDSTEEGLLMHANLGITFDLRAIRSMLPDVKITRFRSQFGLAPFDEEMHNADFRVLVDGKLKFKQTQVKEQGKAGLIDIELSESDRFLTLVTTDGGDPEERISHGRIILSIYGDWCVFIEPHLILETR